MLRMAVLLLVAAGLLAICRMLKIRACFAPMTAISAASLTVYLFGMIGRLDWGCMLVAAAGLAGLGWALVSAVRGNRALLAPDASLVFFLAGAVWMALITRNMGIAHYDDFNHWYRICKIMHAEHAFPTAPDLHFPTYAPGTAVFIYAVTRLVNFSAGNCMWAQELINLAACCCAFAWIPEDADKGVRRAGALVILALCVVQGAMTVSIYALLVDATIAFVALAALAMAQEEGAPPFALALTLAYLGLIKLSGLLLAAFVLLAWRRKHPHASRARLGALSACSLVFRLLYRIRGGLLYPQLAASEQASSLARYAALIGGRSGADIYGVVRRVCAEIFLGMRGAPQVRMLWLCLAALALAGFWLDHKGQKAQGAETLAAFRYASLASGCYAFFLLITYLFSMTTGEAHAHHLACFYRYTGTLTIFVSGVTVRALWRAFAEDAKNARPLVALALAVWLAGSAHFHTGYFWGPENYVWDDGEEQYTTDLWTTAHYFVPENWAYSGERYVVLWDSATLPVDNMTKFLLLCQEHLRSNDVTLCDLQRVLTGELTPQERKAMEQAETLVSMGDYSAYAQEICSLFSVEEYLPGYALPIVRAGEGAGA